jgi:hypothetical protein
MKLLLESGGEQFISDVFWIIGLIICIFITRYIFGIDKILDRLQQQNDNSLMQVKLLKKMLLNQGTPLHEIDEIIKTENPSPDQKQPIKKV